MADATNAVVAKPLKVVGGIYVVAQSVALPKSADAQLPSEAKALGYITEEGVARAVSKDTNKIFAWGGATLATTRKNASGTVKFAAAEYLNPDAQKLYYGEENVTFTPASPPKGAKLDIKGNLNVIPPHVAIIIDVASDYAAGRIVYPDWQASEIEDVVLKDDELTALDLTGDIFPDQHGNSFYEYWVKKPAA